MSGITHTYSHLSAQCPTLVCCNKSVFHVGKPKMGGIRPMITQVGSAGPGMQTWECLTLQPMFSITMPITSQSEVVYNMDVCIHLVSFDFTYI